MTRRKHLKDAVRARMARTGERYTTPHRHLTGLAPSRQPGLPAGVLLRRRAPHDDDRAPHPLADAIAELAAQVVPVEREACAALAATSSPS